MQNQTTMQLDKCGKYLSLGFLIDQYTKFDSMRFTTEVDADSGLIILGADEE